ncbi:MAG: HEAT repeat domain-containing protein [Planctomycetota bacterium]|nr:HEAT repeat domain-containing protein [Planctomycetota bacterium]
MSSVHPRRPLILSVLVLTLVTGWASPPGGGKPSLRKRQKELQSAVRKGDATAAAAAIREIAALKTSDAMETLLLAALAIPDQETYASLRKAFVRVEAGKGLDFLNKVISRPLKVARKFERWQLRALLAEAFASRRDESTFAPLVAALSDDNFPVRRAAIRALAKRGDRRAIPALIDLLEAEENDPGILWEEALRGLQILTDTGIIEAVDWGNWWAAHQEDAPPRPAGRKRRSDDQEKTQSPTFFGVKLISKRIVFLIDVSGSMRLADPTVGGEQPKGDETKERPGSRVWRRARERLSRAKNELISTLNKLRPSVRFNIVAFAGSLEAFAPRALIPAYPMNLKEAIRFVQDLEARGGTATDDALREGFLFKEANTIVLLSDGVPAKANGDNPTSGEIIEMVRRRNRFRKARIYTFGFDGMGIRPPGMRNFPRMGPEILEEFRQMMQKLAEENEGTYTSIR